MTIPRPGRLMAGPTMWIDDMTSPMRVRTFRMV